MAIGMTYDEYWHGDPFMVRAFYKANKARKKMMNEQMWLNGIYTLRALEATVGNLMKKKTEKLNEYPEEPIAFEQENTAPVEKTKQQKEQEATFAKAYMMQMMQVGKEWGKR